MAIYPFCKIFTACDAARAGSASDAGAPLDIRHAHTPIAVHALAALQRRLRARRARLDRGDRGAARAVAAFLNEEQQLDEVVDSPAF